MFNLFKKKEKQQSPAGAKDALRLTMLGQVEPNEWPKGSRDVIPWSLFVEARNQVTKSAGRKTIEILKSILEMPGLESRHYLQAWYFLRKLKVYPSPEESQRVYGVVVDVCLPQGYEYVAAYPDYRARYVNYTGGGIFWDAPDTSLNPHIDTLLQACAVAATHVPPLENVIPNPPEQVDAVQLCILTPGGIRHGISTFEGWAKTPTGGPIVAAATDLMKSLVEKQVPQA